MVKKTLYKRPVKNAKLKKIQEQFENYKEQNNVKVSEILKLRKTNERLREALEKVMEVEAPIMEGWETPAYKIARQALDGDSDVERKQNHHT